MYRVRGSDQNVYGPIPAETIRQWIGERRLNRDSQVCREGEETWQSLGQLTEFADALSGAAVTPAGASIPDLPQGGVYQAPDSGPTSRKSIQSQTSPAAICLIVFGALMALLAVVNVITQAISGGQTQQLPAESPEWLKQAMKWQTDMPAAVQYGMAALSLLIFALVILGGVKMLQLRARGLVMTAAVLVMIPCFTSCCCVLGLPLGIWVIVLINKPEVRNQFDQA